MRPAVGAFVLPVLLSAAALGQTPTRGKADPSVESPAMPAAVPLQQPAPGAPVPLGILPATPAGPDAGQASGATPGAPTAAEPAITEWVGRSFTVPQRTDILTAPDRGAPSSGTLAEGADADVVGVLEGREWLKVRLPDGSFGFVRAASIPAVTSPTASSAAAASPAAAQSSGQPAGSAALGPVGGDIYVSQPVQGQAAVHDTATLVVAERAVPLYAVDGFGGEPALAMQQYVDSAGRAVNCAPQESKGFVCMLRDGTDVAKAALVNGAARVTPDAPADYVAQQDDAKRAKRGIWRDGIDKVDAVPLSRDPAGAVVLSNSFVPGVQYAGPNGVPAAFNAAAPVNGLAVFGDQPFTLADGDPTPVLYRPGVGWGFWDRYFVWRRAPSAWIPRLEQLHPHGANLHQVNLTRYGFVQTTPYFVGPAVDVSFVPNQPPVPVGFSPYPSPVFAPYLDPGYVAVGAAAAVGLAGIVGGALAGPGAFGPPGMPGMPGGFRPPPGPMPFGPGGRPGFGPPGGPGRLAGFGGPGPHFGGPMGGPGPHFGGPMGMPGRPGAPMGGPMGGPGGGAFGYRPVGAPGMMGRPGGMGGPGGMPMGGMGRPGGMPMGGMGRPGGMPMGGMGRPGGMPMGGMGRPGGMPMGGMGRPGGMPMGGMGRPGGMPMGGMGRPGGMPMGGGRPPGGGAVHVGGPPGRHP